MTRRGWARLVLIGILPVILAAACGTSGYASNGADVPVPSIGHPLVAELYHSCASRYGAAVTPANDGSITPEQALTSYLALPNDYGLRGKLFEPARPPRSYQPVQSVTAGSSTHAATATTAAGSPTSPQWYARHDQKGRVITVLRMDDNGKGWSVTAFWGCVPGPEQNPAQTIVGGYPTGTYPSATT